MGDEYKRRAVKSASERAFELEEEARKLIESPKSDSLFFRRGISDTFIRAAELYKKTGDLNSARENYESALRYAPNKSYEQLAKQGMKSLEAEPPKEKTKYHGYAQQRGEDDASDVDSAVSRWKSRNSKNKKERSISELLSDLEKKANDFPSGNFLGVISISTLLTGLFFVSADFTGYVVANPLTNDMQWVGLCFFACGLVFTFLAIRKKYFPKNKK